MADCKKWGDDTAGAQEEKHTYGKWNLMVSGDEMGKKGNKREEPTVARVQCFHSFCSLPLLLTLLWVEGWKSFVFMTDDTVGEQLADCLPHFYQVIFSIGEEVKKKNRAQFVIMFFARAWHNFTVWDKLHECRGGEVSNLTWSLRSVFLDIFLFLQRQLLALGGYFQCCFFAHQNSH